MDMQPRFFARGNAVSFAGRVTKLGERVVDQLIDVPNNSSSLPVTGGLSHGETGRFALLHDHTWPAPLVSMAAGSTRTWDDGSDQPRVTHVMAVVEDFAIAGRFFVDRAAGYLRSTYRRGADEPDIAIGESTITRMRCEANVINVRWHLDVVNKASTYAGLQKAWARSKAADALDQRVLRPPGTRRHDPKTLPAMKDHVLVTVAELSWADQPHPDVTLDGHVIRWPGFGTVYVGEMLIAHHLRRLTLLRFDLGSPFAMNGASIDVESNGLGLP
jgi:hypothetical protein